MLKFIEKNKKLFLLIAVGVIALAWLCAAPLLFTKVATAGNVHVLYYVRVILRELVAGLAMLAFAVGGFLYWKTGKQFFLIPAGCALGICTFVLDLVMALIQSIVYGSASTLLSAFSSAVIPFLVFAFVGVLSFLKVKGPVFPIVGGAGCALMAVTSLFGGFGNLISFIANSRFYHLDGFAKFLRGCGELLTGGGAMLFYLGLAVLVFLFLWERCNPCEEAAVETVEEASEETPVAEEA